MATNDELIKLATRIAELDSDVRKLRGEFEDHIRVEDEKYKEMKHSLDSIQISVEALRTEIKEPLESYKTAKAGMTFLKFISDTAKWAVPLIVGLWIGYGPMADKSQAPVQQQQMEKTK